MRTVLGLILAVALLSGCSSGSNPSCGNGTCDPGETSATCCTDCPCAGGQSCVDHTCQQGACAAAGQSCATEPCCQGFTCMNNLCQASPASVCGNGTCEAGESQSICCLDCGCPQGQACQAGACAVLADCGDGTCSGQENMQTCCLDCGCPSPGQRCDGQSCTAAQNVSTMNFDWLSTCKTAPTIVARLFDDNLGIQWPSHSKVFDVISTKTRATILCRTGDKICWGARNPANGMIWGKSDDGSQLCSACCQTCAAITIAVPPFTC